MLRAKLIVIDDFEVATEIAFEEVLEMTLDEGFDTKDAGIVNGNLTCCSADMLLFARNIFWISRINLEPVPCPEIMLSSSVCPLK